MKGADGLSCVKMRASLDGSHISGAERIVARRDVPKTVASLVSRALSHEKGAPDFINVKVEPGGEPLLLRALPVSTDVVSTPEEGWRRVDELLRDAGFSRTAEIRDLFRETYSMRGAMLLDADTLERLEPDRERGVRATYMDAADSLASAAGVKDHYAEAVVLATKVQNAPGIVGEICMSDDPDYVTGYVATKSLGYRRITVLKEKGDPSGGRIFLYRGRREDVPETLRFLERRSVLVTDVPPLARPVAEQRFEGLANELEAVKTAGLWRTIRCFGGSSAVNLSSNDYLGLANDPRVKSAASKAALEWGAGTGASRLVTGTQSPHVALERHIADFKGAEAAIVYSTGYMANVGAITALVGKGDTILSDELNHASIIDGCRMSGADVVVYRHLDMDDLSRRISRCRGYRRRLVVSDGVFSMDGDMLPLPEFLDICRLNDAFSMVDEAHSIGVAGATGRGLVEHFGCRKPDVMMGTLSKSLGAQGGYVCGSSVLIDYLRQKSRPFIFNTAPCAAAMAGADAALSVLEAEPERVARLAANVRLFIGELARNGIRAKTESAIVPIVVGDERRAVEISAGLEADGFIVSAIRHPTVAKGAARLRVAVSSEHDRDSLVRAASAIARHLAR
jgi:6-carboxyhexanoate--CoA ligase